MFNLDVFDKYSYAKDALEAIDVVRGFYKERWAEVDEIKDNDALDEIDTRLSELDVMQVEIERIINDYKEFLTQ